jgi:hypothetical protein
MEVRKNKGIAHYQRKAGTEINSSSTVLTVLAVSFFAGGFMTKALMRTALADSSLTR